MVPLKDSLARVNSLARILNESTDALNGTIEAIEKSLADAGVGVTSWLHDHLIDEVRVQGGVPPQPSIHEGWAIGYTKVAGDWKIAAQRVKRVCGNAEGDSDCPRTEIEILTEPSALLKAPRQVRVEAPRLLEPLLNAMASRMEGFIAEIEGARKLVVSEPEGKAPEAKPRGSAVPPSVTDPVRTVIDQLNVIRSASVPTDLLPVSTKLMKQAAEQADGVARLIAKSPPSIDELERLRREVQVLHSAVAAANTFAGADLRQIQRFIDEAERIRRLRF
jgi:hypothetical protein